MFKRLAIAVAVILSTLGNTAWATDYVLAVPQQLDRNMAQTIHALIKKLSLKELAANDSLSVIDATGVSMIAQFQVPDGGSAEISTLRAQAMSQATSDWGRFVKLHYLKAEQAAADTLGQVLFPQTLTHLGTQTFANGNLGTREVCVLVIGSPFYRDQREPASNMINGKFPSDGLITSSQITSAFGTADRQGHLSGFNVHFLRLDRPEDWKSDAHEMRVQRVWQLFVKAQNGTLATYSRSVKETVSRFLACDLKPGRTFAWDNTRNVEEMITADNMPVPEEPEEEAPVAESELPELGNGDWLRSLDVPVTHAAPRIEKASFQLGIRWGDDGRCASSDLDFYVRSNPDRPFLFFRNKSSADGTYFKDYQTSPAALNGLERVNIVDQVALSDMEIWINFYNGVCPEGPRGVVRAYVNGRVYETPFHIPARRGNKGKQRANRSDQNWIQIDPAILFNLG